MERLGCCRARGGCGRRRLRGRLWSRSVVITVTGGKPLEQVESHDVQVIVTKRQLGAYLFAFEQDARSTLAELTGVVESRWNYDMRFEEGELRIVPVIFSYDDSETVISS